MNKYEQISTNITNINTNQQISTNMNNYEQISTNMNNYKQITNINKYQQNQQI